jgi:hypothetical protein
MVEPAVKPTAHQRRVAALNAHRPGSLPAQYLGRVPRSHERVKAMAEFVHGQTSADALEALLRPNNKMDRGAVRRALDMLFPRERPIRLAIPDINSPERFDAAMAMVHEAWTDGRISPPEARTLQELCEHRYGAWIKVQRGKLR